LEGGGKLGVAFRLDEPQGKGKGYDRLILDLNRNGDLTDDPVWKAEAHRPFAGRKRCPGRRIV
jgi:hypothetical protein